MHVRQRTRVCLHPHSSRSTLRPKKTFPSQHNFYYLNGYSVYMLDAGAWSSRFKGLQSGLHLGQIQMTNDTARVAGSVVLPVLAYLPLVRLYGCDDSLAHERSLFKLKAHFIVDIAQEHMTRTDLKWQRKLKQFLYLFHC